MWNGKQVSVIFPAYNEEEGVRQAVENFRQAGVVDEVVVVDNNSTDRTAEEAERAGARVVREQVQGYGAALQRGLQEATGDYLVLAEPDGTFLGRDLLKLLSYAEDADLVCGTRTTKMMIWSGANMGWFLRTGNTLLAKLLEVLYNLPSLSDCGCTLRLITRDAVRKLLPELRVTGSHFLPEMVILAWRFQFRIIEIPVNYRARQGRSKITGTFYGSMRTGMAMLWLILSRRLRLHRSA